MRKERWYAIGNDGNVYIVFAEQGSPAWDYLEEYEEHVLFIGCFDGYENCVCIQRGIGM